MLVRTLSKTSLRVYRHYIIIRKLLSPILTKLSITLQIALKTQDLPLSLRTQHVAYPQGCSTQTVTYSVLEVLSFTLSEF
jgi:hypothetical protein